MKNLYNLLIIFFIFFVFQLKAQVFIIDEDFSGGVTPAAGWVYSGTITSSGATGNFGRLSPNIVISGIASSITYSWTGVANKPDLVSFMYRNSSGSSAANCAASSLLVEESINGVAWTTVSGTPLKIQNGITSEFTGALKLTTRYVRVTLNPVAGVTCLFDDFKIRKAGNCISDPDINMIIIDGGCVGGCEGANEVVFAKNGNSSMAVNDLELSIQGPGGTGGTIVSGTNTAVSSIIWTKNSTYTAAQLSYIAALTGTCTVGTFTPVPATNLIPANARILMFLGSAPTATYNLNTICGLGPFYVVFASFDCVGKLSNSGCTQCYRTISLMNNATGCVDTKTYTSISSGASGTSIVFDPTGGAPSEVQTTCNNFKVLPIELVDFFATKNDKVNNIVWKVASEEDVVYYTIDKSNDGVNFTELATIFANNETQRKAYNTIDDAPFYDITYYRLGTKEKDGKVNYYKIISVDEKSSDWNSIHYQQEQNLVIEFKNTIPKNSTINLFDLSGKLLVEQAVKESQTTINTQAFAEGIYFVKITTPYKTENFKIIITK